MNIFPYSNFHDLNLDWLLEAVKQLRTDVDGLIGSATPSNSTPQMDGAGAPGISVNYSRGDHQHPTDTSRASATALATLTARVDSFTGSAIASDAMPQMDGVGSAGTGGNYSRGDHVHPSDTSKVNKSGDTMTGNLRIDGALVPLHELKFMHVNSIGWIRIADVPKIPGTWVKFAIVRKGDVAPSETHTIELRINQTGIAFKNESSFGDVLYIDKIRYSNAGKVDIHMDQIDESDIGVRLIAVGPTEAITNNVKLIPFQGVAPSPGGEIILPDYTFIANSGTPITFTPASGSVYEACWYARIGNVCYFHLNIKDLTPSTNTRVFTLPTGFRPLNPTTIIGQGEESYGALATCTIQQDGSVDVYSQDHYALVCGSFICN